MSLTDQLAAFGVAGGGLELGQGLIELFRSHPPLADRIAVLERGR